MYEKIKLSFFVTMTKKFEIFENFQKNNQLEFREDFGSSFEIYGLKSARCQSSSMNNFFEIFLES